MGKGNFQEARTNFEKAYILRHEFLPPDHELVGISQLALGECLLALKDYPTTIGYFEQAHASLLQHPDKYEKELTLVLEGLTEAYVRLDQPDKAAHYRTLLARR
jgi:tetratricopeptide (TPR) repeat protein